MSGQWFKWNQNHVCDANSVPNSHISLMHLKFIYSSEKKIHQIKDRNLTGKKITQTTAISSYLVPHNSIQTNAYIIGKIEWASATASKERQTAKKKHSNSNSNTNNGMLKNMLRNERSWMRTRKQARLFIYLCKLRVSSVEAGAIQSSQPSKLVHPLCVCVTHCLLAQSLCEFVSFHFVSIWFDTIGFYDYYYWFAYFCLNTVAAIFDFGKCC